MEKIAEQIKVTDKLFGVYPLSITFERNYNTQFDLYFENNFKIISKYQTPNSIIRKQQTIFLNSPQQVQHFKVIPEKMTDYQWCIYIKRVDSQSQREQFVEGIKVSLKSLIEQYKQDREGIIQNVIQFKNTKCKLVYIICFATDQPNLLSLIQKSTEQKQSIITTDSKVAQVGSKEVEKQIQEFNFAMKNENNTKEQNFQPTIISSHNMLNKQNTNNRIQKQLSQLKSKQSQYSNSLYPGDQNFVLSNSDLQIGNQIEEQIILSERIKNKSQFSSNQLPSEIKQYSEKQMITMTSSELLNQKGEVILPFYKNKKYLIVMILLIISVLFFILREGQDLSKSSWKNKRNKIKKEKVSKKDRGKDKTDLQIL